MLPLIPQKNDEETWVKFQKNLLPKLQKNYDIIKTKNAIQIPKLPPLKTFLQQYNDDTKYEKINHIFNENQSTIYFKDQQKQHGK